MKKIMVIIGVASIGLATAVYLTSVYITDYGFLIETIENSLDEEPLSASQRLIISDCINEIQVNFESEVQQKNSAILIAITSLLINGIILILVGFIRKPIKNVS